MVHQYKNNGYNILLDVNSGSVHVVDDLIYDMVPYYKEKGLDETVALLKDKYPEAEIREAAEDLDELIAAVFEEQRKAGQDPDDVREVPFP